MNGATLNTNTASGKLIFTILIAYASFEREQTGERTKVVLNNKKKTGKAYCASVFGFDKVKGELVPNPIEQEAVERIKMMHDKGVSVNRISKVLNRFKYETKNNKKFYPSTIQAIIRNSIHNGQ